MPQPNDPALSGELGDSSATHAPNPPDPAFLQRSHRDLEILCCFCFCWGKMNQCCCPIPLKGGDGGGGGGPPRAEDGSVFGQPWLAAQKRN